MRGSLAAAALVSMSASATSFAQAQQSRLVPGAYDVDAHLEETFSVDKPEHYRVCLTDSATRPAHGLFILTPDTPLSICAVRNVREGAGQITFDIVCEGEGPNAGRATAAFDIEDGAFQGRIDMLMGGKNMRMSEFQSGRRVGECRANASR